MQKFDGEIKKREMGKGEGKIERRKKKKKETLGKRKKY